MSALYEKLRPSLLANAVNPTDVAAASAELSIANEAFVQLHVGYTADGASKVLRLYPEVRVSIPDVADLWLPALAAIPDVAGATVDTATGLLPLTMASPIIEVDGIDATEVLVTIDVPCRTGDRFRVRYEETGYDGDHPAELTLIAAASRGAS